MAKASDNQFPKVLLTPVDPSTITVPSGTIGLVSDSTDSNKLKRKDSSGTVTTIEGSTGGGGAAGFTRVRKSATQTITAGAWTAITWDTEDYDTLSLHDNVTNNTRFTAGSTGVFQFVTALNLGTSSGDAYLQYSINGTRVPGRTNLVTGTSNRCGALTRLLALTAGDYVEANIYISGGGTLTTISDDACVLECFKVGTT